jgi:hypothetical protein
MIGVADWSIMVSRWAGKLPFEMVEKRSQKAGSIGKYAAGF